MPPPPETARWVARLDDGLSSKLAAVGLLPRREFARLGAFLDDYIAERVDTKESTRLVYSHTQRCLVGYFGPDKPLRDVTAGDADLWRRWLAINQKLADNTVRRRAGMARQFFRVAVRRRIIPDNPFADQSVSVLENRKRDFFVTRDTIDKVMGCAPMLSGG